MTLLRFLLEEYPISVHKEFHSWIYWSVEGHTEKENTGVHQRAGEDPRAFGLNGTCAALQRVVLGIAFC